MIGRVVERARSSQQRVKHAQPSGRAPQMESAGPAQVLHEGMSKLLEFMRQPQRSNQHAIAAFLHNEIAP
jgi:hypothetical protein